MRPLEEIIVRWQATFTGNANLSDLRNAVRDPTEQNPCTSGLRSICWKAFLLFENLDRSTWTKTLSDSRSAYTCLREHFLRHIEHPDDLSESDPLTEVETSPWYTLRHDEELRAEIFQDVERCMPENLFFHEPSTQTMLLDILFIYCKLNRDIGYRQGMHEVLAPVLWVIAGDAIDPMSLDAGPKNQAIPDSLILASFDRRYIEHDAFTLFGIIMQTVKASYEMGGVEQPGATSSQNNSPIVERSKRIHEGYLHCADPELAEHLTSIEILPQIFLIRWIRLLFGREFPFDGVLSLWDILFAENPALDLVDLICVSMLLRIRWQLIDADYSAALTLLLRYPVPSPPYGPPTFVTDALYLRQNLSADGGIHIISRYSQKSPSPPSEGSSRSKLRKDKRLRSGKHNQSTGSMSSMMSPTKFLQDQGGIEGIIQEAAKGVYNRSEKWGVGKALRDAAQALQPGENAPRRVPNGSRWSLDDGRNVPSSSAEVNEAIHTLEQRNKALAKLLETAMAELWVQQNEFAKEKADAAADAVSIAIAKVQFVQVYLENPGMPIPSENAAIQDNPNDEIKGALSTAPSVQVDTIDETGKPIPQAPVSTNNIGEIASGKGTTNGSSDSPPQTQSRSAAEPSTTITGNAHVTNPKPVSNLSPVSFQKPRPSLAQSSFSWMLGEGQRKSSFVSASPFPSEKRSARAKAGFLFGDDSEGKKRSHAPNDKSSKTTDKDEEAITLGDLKPES